MSQPEQVRATQRRSLLLGRVRDPSHALGEAEIGRRFHACLERVAPALVGELNLLIATRGSPLVSAGSTLTRAPPASRPRS